MRSYAPATALPILSLVLSLALCAGSGAAAAQAGRALPAPVHPDTLPTLIQAWSLPASLAPLVTNSYAPRMVRSGMLIYIYDHHGRRVVAVKAASGKVAWHAPVPSRTATGFAFTPLIFNKRLFVANDQNLYVFDALSGEPRWQMPIKGVPVNGLGRSKHHLYLPWIRTAGGEAVPGVTLWAIDSRRARVEWTKKFADDRMAYVEGDPSGAYYVGHGGAVYGLTPDRGDYKWKLRVQGTVTAPPILKSGRLYITTLRKKAGWTGTGVYVIDVAAGKLVWQTKLAGTQVDKFLHDKRLVTVEGDGRLTEFDEAGKKVFELDLNFVDEPRSLHGVAVGTRGYIFSSHQDGNGYIRLVELEKKQLLVTANALDLDVRDIIPAAKILFLDGADGDVYAYQLRSEPPRRPSVPPVEFAKEMLDRVANSKGTIRGLAPRLAGLGAKALPAIEPALQAQNPYVVQVAAEAIGLIGSRRSLPALTKAVQTLSSSPPPPEEVLDPLLGVLDALALLRDGRAVPALQRLLQDEGQGHMRRRSAYVALGAISTPVSLAPIVALRAAKAVETTRWDPQAFTPSTAYKVEHDVVADITSWPEELRRETSMTVQAKDGKTFTAALSPYLGGYNDIWVGPSDLSGAIDRPVFTGLTKPEVLPGKRIRIEKVKADKDKIRVGIQYQRGKRWVSAQPVVLSLAELRTDQDKDGLPDVVERRLHLCLTSDDCDGDGIKDADDLNPLASKKQKLTEEQLLFREAFFSYFAFLKRRGVVVVDPGSGPSFEVYGRVDPVLSLRRPTIERLRKEVGLHAIDFVSFGGPYPEGGGSGDALPKVLWNAKQTEATMGMDIFRSGDNAVAYNVTLKKVGKIWVVSRFFRVWTTNE